MPPDLGYSGAAAQNSFLDDIRIEIDDRQAERMPRAPNGPRERKRTKRSGIEAENTASLKNQETAKVGDFRQRMTGLPAVNTTQPKIWTKGHPYVYMKPIQDDPWITVKTGMDKYDDGMCKAWNGELDTLLTFTGLFSAAVTAFCAESLKSLSEDPAVTTNSLLSVLSNQLADSNALPAGQLPSEVFVPTVQNVRINVLYFLSLTLALSVSSICILGKQWIREYQKDISVSPCDAVRVRQARLDALVAYQVPQILASLPVILLMALLLFFSGLLTQLWNVSDHTTATLVSIVVALTAFLAITTTIIPAHHSGRALGGINLTPFRSPQAWAYMTAYRWIRKTSLAIRNACSRLLKGMSSDNSDMSVSSPNPIDSWAELDMSCLKKENLSVSSVITSVHRALHWTLKVLGNASEIESSVLWCLQRQHHPPHIKISETQLGRYVLPGDTASDDFEVSEELDCLDHLYYSHIMTGSGSLSSTEGPYGNQPAELIIRFANHAINSLIPYQSEANDVHGAYRVVVECWRKLGMILSSLPPSETLTSLKVVQKQQDILLEQMSRMLQRFFWALKMIKATPKLDWKPIINALVRLHTRAKSSARIWPITSDIIAHTIPSLFQRHRSVELVSALGMATVDSFEYGSKAGLQLFTCLDKIMVDISQRQRSISTGSTTGSERRSDEIYHQWWTFRWSVVKKSRDPAFKALAHLPNHYFETMHEPLQGL